MKSLKEKIKVMQAADDGKEIERYIGGDIGWYTPNNPKEINYDWTNQDYRIKQQPMEFWVNVYNGVCSTVHLTEKEALAIIPHDEGWETIKVREITE